MPTASRGPEFSVRQIPFSLFGSWLDISPVVAEQVYADDLHLVSHQTGLNAILALVPVAAGRRVDATVVAEPSRVRWIDDSGEIEAIFETVDTLRFRGRGLGLRISAASPVLTPFVGSYLFRDPNDGAYIFTIYGSGRRYRATVVEGPPVESFGVQALGAADRGLVVGADGESWEVALEEFETARPPYHPLGSFDRVQELSAGTFRAFVDAIAPWRSADTPATELAAYVMWSAAVRPAGFVTRPAVLMSKHWMDKVWSWDHCFNALALIDGAPELAWDQFWLPFDHQDVAGSLPDSVAHSEVLYNFVKPPIHGWAFRQLMKARPLGRIELADAYHKLEAWTNYWSRSRTAPGRALSHYHHGNDSGWDNATTFDSARVIESSDLAAFLIIQMQVLAEVAAELGRKTSAQRWSNAADEMTAALLSELWIGDRFVARSVATGEKTASSSLLDLMAISLGPEIPDKIHQALAVRIEAHMTAHGLATELESSTRYESDGYWRGPIWAPSTVLVEDGLRRAGYAYLADEISERFRALCEKSGFAENFDAQSGVGLRDRAYTWTASSYLILAAAHERRRSEARS